MCCCGGWSATDAARLAVLYALGEAGLRSNPEQRRRIWEAIKPRDVEVAASTTRAAWLVVDPWRHRIVKSADAAWPLEGDLDELTGAVVLPFGAYVRAFLRQLVAAERGLLSGEPEGDA